MEYKAVPTFSEADLATRTVVGFAAITGNVDDGADIVHAGAFVKTIKERAARVRHLWQHDSTRPPIAAIVSLQEVGKADLPERLLKLHPEVTGGLQVTRKYFDDPFSDQVFQGVVAGAISEMSFGFDPVKFDFAEKEAGGTVVRNIRELRLWDTSDVNWGMNPVTVAAKVAPMLEAFKESLEPARFDVLSNLVLLAERVTTTDALKTGRVLSAGNLTRLKTALDTLSEILLAAEPPADEEAAKALTAMILQRLSIAERDPILSLR